MKSQEAEKEDKAKAVGFIELVSSLSFAARQLAYKISYSHRPRLDCCPVYTRRLLYP